MIFYEHFNTFFHHSLCPAKFLRHQQPLLKRSDPQTRLAFRPLWLALKLLLLGSSPIGDNDYLELERSDDQPEGSEPAGSLGRV